MLFNIPEVILVGFVQVNEASDTSGFQLLECLCGILEILNSSVLDGREIWSYVMRCCSDQLSLVGQPVCLRFAVFFFDANNLGWTSPSNFSRVRAVEHHASRNIVGLPSVAG